MTGKAESREVRTHRGLDRALCGEPVEMAKGRAVVGMTLRSEMAADDSGLVHGGFVFGLADHAAMLAVNHPNVVLARADVRFTAPATVGDYVTAAADLVGADGRKHLVRVTVECDGRTLLTGDFGCYVPPSHVLVEPEEQR